MKEVKLSGLIVNGEEVAIYIPETLWPEIQKVQSPDSTQNIQFNATLRPFKNEDTEDEIFIRCVAHNKSNYQIIKDH